MYNLLAYLHLIDYELGSPLNTSGLSDLLGPLQFMRSLVHTPESLGAHWFIELKQQRNKVAVFASLQFTAVADGDEGVVHGSSALYVQSRNSLCLPLGSR